MLFLNYVVFVVAGLVSGWLASLISGNRIPALVVALLFLICMVVNHYFLVWDELPAWYNLIVPVIVSGSIVLGGSMIGARSNTVAH